ncbi:MAG TPA: DUF2510 domain-containing protein [Pseudolysinimonas sp.]|nr:DUF2510 domain-containing protein [Pseudolysinimonas sp.]
MSDPNALPAAGWYPDPDDAASDRWWNGVSWSDQRRGRNAPTGWAPVAGSVTTASATPVPPVPVPPVPLPPVAPYPAGATRPDPYAGNAATAAAAYPVPAVYGPTGDGVGARNPLAVGGMVTSLVALMCNFILFGAPGITGGILSIVALRRANRLARSGVTTGTGRGMAIAGIVAGFTGALLWNWFYFGVILNFS